MAEAGKLTIIAAGNEAALARVQPLLQLMGQKVVLVGAEPPGGESREARGTIF